MALSIFDLFSVGIGPSSSHTVGPMIAATHFVDAIKEKLGDIAKVDVDLYGSLALTGLNHHTDIAVMYGLENNHPEDADPDELEARIADIRKHKSLNLCGAHPISFDPEKNILFHKKEFLDKHSNGMRISAIGADNSLIFSEVYYSIGGGFVVTEAEFGIEKPDTSATVQPYPFGSGKDLLNICEENNFSIAKLMLENEKIWRSEDVIRQQLLCIDQLMQSCIERGCRSEGILPGGLNIKRRAPELHRRLEAHTGIRSIHEDADIMNRLNLYAMAVNEENAAGGRIVTAPTNGAAGVLPAVLSYYKNFHKEATEQGVIDFLLTAGAIGMLYKQNASISGAEVGCQGEIGVASSMAAAGLTAALGGTVFQIENAAEIAMEHHLGMTCDPINGLVQVPCIERNAMGANKAVNAARLALIGDGQHHVSLDKVIDTMFRTGRDMMTIYKETSEGGLAVNIPEC